MLQQSFHRGMGITVVVGVVLGGRGRMQQKLPLRVGSVIVVFVVLEDPGYLKW